ncbi:MAG: hypothetical protein K9G60_12355 [Pseudolabrys sp.]|nr:hypothetical protein [Pseudolabrys sp.]
MAHSRHVETARRLTQAAQISALRIFLHNEMPQQQRQQQQQRHRERMHCLCGAGLQRLATNYPRHTALQT